MEISDENIVLSEDDGLILGIAFIALISFVLVFNTLNTIPVEPCPASSNNLSKKIA
jgi:hypothetical protein